MIALLAACSEEPRPPTAMEFVENPVLLDATIVRCVENRDELRYEAECINARDAVDLIAVKAEKARRAELEAESERKREALRASQEVADEAKRRALEEERRLQEAEFLGLVVTVPAGTADPSQSMTPEGTIQEGAMPDAATAVTPGEADAAVSSSERIIAAPTDEAQPAKTDLEEVREKLEQRQEAPRQQPVGQQ